MSRTWTRLGILLGLALLSTGCCVDRVYRGGGCAGGFEPWLDSGCCSGAAPHRVAGQRLANSGGCGEVYWGEWISTPPDDCDPCDGCGNWVGPRCCPPRLFGWLSNLGGPGIWGYRGDMSACCEHGPGCTECGGEEIWDDEVIMDGPAAAPKGEPRPAAPKAAKPKPEAEGEVAPPAEKHEPKGETQARHTVTRRKTTVPTPALRPVPSRARPVSAYR